ncbi:flagellar M-ring protein FliF [Micromonospora pattaloongensis]|uniref:Flagellar M-ring protein n=1 Tax=Micromonospora pattaloongensis TaxID=405436 RepID=A0A1H3MYK8_9ACTN|nr:flagellar basal-body MS-ring/collar protein FliF [Micromonospora pattaloongensis]SDY81059.1 flagellar M-ring protein FliF [Micromonospora pattaloongensis]
MRNRIPRVLRRPLDIFASFTPGQKAVTVFAVLALVVGGTLFANWAATPAYVPLFNNLAASDAAAITEKLTAAGTPYELADGGQTIMVPQDQVYDLRLQMSGEGLPAQADTGYSLLDKQGITTSEFMQHVGYQRALEGELSKTIKSIEGVKAATVHLVIPQKDIFSNDQQKPTASVLVASESGRSLAHGQVQAIVHLVASSVEGLNPDEVTVAGADGKVLSAGGGETLAADSDLRSQQTAQFEQRMNGALQRMLDSVVGPGNAVVQTTADLDFDQTETKTQRYTADPAVPPLSQSTSRETYTGTGGANGGVLGPDNIQVPGGAGNGTGNYNSTKETRNNAVGMVTETRKSAPGNVRRLSVSVLINSKTATGVDNAQVEQMVTAAAGLNTARGDGMSVTALPFDTAVADKANKAEEDAAAADRQAELISYAKTAALVLVVLVLLFMAWRASRKSKRSGLSPEELAQLEEMQAALEQTRLQAIAAAEAETAALPPAPGRNGPTFEDEQRDARRKELTEMVAEQPEDVANLLRGWLAERR